MRQPSVEPLRVPHVGPATDNIPDELKQRAQWACFYLKPRGNGKFGKPPINPATGESASSTDPTTWGTFAEAIQYYEAHRNDLQRPICGIGFMFSETDPYCGIDQDDVFKEGELEGSAAQIIDELDTYAEESFSGTGIHQIARAELMGRGCNQGGIEIYYRDRFFVVTGRVLDGHGAIQSRQNQVHDLYLRATAASKGSNASSKPDTNSYVDSDVRPGHAPAEEQKRVIALLRRNKKAAALFGGTVAPYKSRSHADMALCGLLAFYSRKDPGLMDGVFRQSGLFGPKWDSARGSESYGRWTICQAIARQNKTWQPHAAPGSYSFPSELLDVSRIVGPVDALMLQVVYRKTALFGKEDDWIADRQIAKALRMTRLSVGMHRRPLQVKNLLLITQTIHVGREERQYRSVNLGAIKLILGTGSDCYRSSVRSFPLALLDIAQIIGPAKTSILQSVWRQSAGFYTNCGKIDYRQIGDAVGLEKKSTRRHCLTLMQRKLLSTGIPEEGELTINLPAIEALVQVERMRKMKFDEAGCAPVLRMIERVQQKAAGSSSLPTNRTVHSPGKPVVMANDLQVIGTSKTAEAEGPGDRQTNRLFQLPASFSPKQTSEATLSGPAAAVTIVNFLREHDVHVKEAVAYRWLSDLLPEDWSAVNLAKFLYKRGILKTAAQLPEHRAALLIEKVLKNIAGAQSSTRVLKQRPATKGTEIVLVPGATRNTNQYFKTYFGIDGQSYQDKYDDQISAAIRRMDQKIGARLQGPTSEAKAA